MKGYSSFRFNGQRSCPRSKNSETGDHSQEARSVILNLWVPTPLEMKDPFIGVTHQTYYIYMAIHNNSKNYSNEVMEITLWLRVTTT